MSKDLMKNGKVFCVNAGWAQIKRKHKGHYIKKLNDADVKNVVKLLALSLEKACDGYDTCLGSGQLEHLPCIRYYHKRHLSHTVNPLSAARVNPSFQISTKIQQLQDAKTGNLDTHLLLGWSKPLKRLVRNIFPAFLLDFRQIKIY